MKGEKAFVDLEECDNAIRCGDGQTDRPRQPIQKGFCIRFHVDAQKCWNGQGADGDHQTCRVEQSRIETRSGSVFLQKKTDAILDGRSLLHCEICESVECGLQVVDVFHLYAVREFILSVETRWAHMDCVS